MKDHTGIGPVKMPIKSNNMELAHPSGALGDSTFTRMKTRILLLPAKLEGVRASKLISIALSTTWLINYSK